MSFLALAWAVDSKVEHAADKLILLALADRHNTEHGLAYPSIAWLTEFSSLDRKTVIASLDRLEAGGFIRDSGTRVGKTKQVKAYALNFEQSQKRNGSVFPSKESQKRDTEPVKEPETRASTTVEDNWAPSPAVVERIKTQFSLDDDEIEAERIVFILKNQANETVVKNIDAAFAVWCSRRGGLAHPPPAPRRSGGKAKSEDTRNEQQRLEDYIAMAKSRLEHMSDKDPKRREILGHIEEARIKLAALPPPIFGDTNDPVHDHADRAPSRH